MTKDTTAGRVEAVLRRAADEAYRVCAETRHVSLGNKARDAILALAASPAPAPAGVEEARELLGPPAGWSDQCEALQVWTRSAFLAGEKVANESWHKHELYRVLNRVISWLRSAEDAASLLALEQKPAVRIREPALENGPASLADAHSNPDPHPEPVKEG